MSTAERVVQEMLRRMLWGELQPGTWLRQDELAAQLGVSKIPVREALQRLAAQGLLRVEPQRGVVVPRLAWDDAHEIFELRLAMEPRLLRRAVPKLSKVDLAKAEEALESTELPLSASNWQFHRALYEPSGWQRGLALVEILHAAVAPYVVLYTADLGGDGTSSRQHGEILMHCRYADADAACEVLVRHLEQAAVALQAFWQEG